MSAFLPAALPVTRPTPSFLVVLGQAAAQAGRCAPLAGALYLPGLLLGALATQSVAGTLLDASTLGPWTAHAADGDLLQVLAEAGLSFSTTSVPGDPPLALEALPWRLAEAVAMALFGVLLHGLAYSLLAGGVLARLAGDTSTRFLDACQRWAWPMLRFGVLVMVLFPLLAAAGGAVLTLLPGRGALGVTAKLLLLAGWLTWVNGLLEYARADMVVRDDPHAWRAIAHALRLPARPGLCLQALLTWSLLALLGAVAWSIVGPLVLAVPATALPAAFLLQQGLALAGAWLKLLRLAAAVELATAGAGVALNPRSANMEAP